MVLAGGGNTSVKSDGQLLVKGSGAHLSEAGPASFVDLDRAALQALLERQLSASRAQREAEFKEGVLAARRAPELGQRPSVESLLHHLMPGRFVAHVHANLVNQFSCCRQGKRLVLGALGRQVVWVELVDPGFALAKALQVRLEAFAADNAGGPPRAVILENHGLVVSGATPAEALDHIDWLLGELKDLKAAAEGAGPGLLPTLAPAEAGPFADAVRSTLTDQGSVGGRAPIVIFDGSDAVAGFVSAENGRELASGGPVTPDQIVYCRSFPLWLATFDGEAPVELSRRLSVALQEYSARHACLPAIVLVERLGLFACGPSERQADLARAIYADAMAIMTGAHRLGGVRYLDDDFRQFIETWEVETYRKQVSMGA